MVCGALDSLWNKRFGAIVFQVRAAVQDEGRFQHGLWSAIHLLLQRRQVAVLGFSCDEIVLYIHHFVYAFIIIVVIFVYLFICFTNVLNCSYPNPLVLTFVS